MIKLREITRFLDTMLQVDEYSSDSANNGLQVEGSKEVRKAFFAVDSSLDLFARAAEENADFVFVHHGISWKDNLKRITGYNARMLAKLFSYNISLYAAHLPLDANLKIGHNILIAKILSLKKIAKFAKYAGYEIGFMGDAPRGATAAKFAEILRKNLGASTRIFGDPDKGIHKCGIVSGGGGDCIQDALDNDLDCFVTGEIGHSNYHIIKDSGINLVVAGHYCTEKPGVLAVMKEIQKKFKIKCEFIDMPTGM